MDDPVAWFIGDDYDGRSGFVKGRDGLKWFILNCPAEAERGDDPLGRKPGEFIWPERFRPEFWAPYKRVQRTWSSLYQQRPAPAAGLMFKREWFAGKIVKPADLPTHMHRVRAWDFAALTEEESADAAYSVAVKMARSGERLFIGPVWRRRESPAGVDAAIDAIVRKDGAGCVVSMPQDPGQAGKDQAQRRGSIARRAGARDVRVTPEYGDKVYRADGLASEAEKGNVFLVDDGTWDLNAFLDELCDFPVGRFKDQVDAASRACNELMDRGNIRTASVGFG
jgi:predicted phage terminase large subunit-like protein